MTPDLVAAVTRGLSGGLLQSRVAVLAGVPPENATHGIACAVPAVFAGLLKAVSMPVGAAALVQLIGSGRHERVLSELGLASEVCGKSTEGLLESARELLAAVLGERSNAVTEVTALAAHLERGACGSLLAVTTPLVLAVVATQLRERGGIGVASLVSLLNAQRPAIAAAAPAGLAGALAAALDLRDLDEPVERAGSVARPAPLAVQRPATGFSAATWLLSLAVILVTFLGVRGWSDGAIPGAPAQLLPALGKEEGKVEGEVTLRLPGGVLMPAQSNGLEAQLLRFLSDYATPVDEITWFSLDQVEFVGSSARLRASSGPQLARLATILRAYPQVKLRIGGYASSSADPAAGLELSGTRARSTMEALIARGIDAGRLEAEGYGDQYPAAAGSRGIDVRVIQK